MEPDRVSMSTKSESSLEATIDVPRDSLKKRYIFKIISNFIGLISNVIVQAIAPRSLGPQAFGDFNFLTNFFDQVLEMADGRSSVGALVKVSLRPNETGLVVFYLYFSILIPLLVFGSIGIIFGLGLDQLIWPGQVGKFIVLAALWSTLVWLHGVLHKLCDAYGFTREAEWVRIQQRVISVAVLTLMFATATITLETFFYYYIFLLAYLLVGFAAILMMRGRWPKWADWKLPTQRIRDYTKEFYTYASPLFVYVAVESMVLVLDRWVLQRFSGSAEQGYFGFAYQMGYVSILFVGAIAPLIQREFSVAHAAKNFTHMAYLFKRYMPMLFSLSAFFTGFIAFQSDKLVHLFAGSQFNASILAIAIMAFYPMFFTFSRVTSSVFYATGETQLFRNLGLIVQGVGLIMTWVLIASKKMGGLEMGAVGLAIKLVVVQAVLVNIQVWFSCRLLHIKFREYFVHQSATLLCFLVLGFLATRFVDDVLMVYPNQYFWEFLIGGTFYCGLVGLVGYAVPSLFGIHRNDILQLISYVLKRLKFDNRSTTYSPALTYLAREADSQVTLSAVPLRVVIVSASNSIHAVRWANAMVVRGHDVHVISLHPRGTDEFDRRVKEIYLKFGPPWGYFLNVPKMASVLKRISPDMIHVHYASGYGTLTSLATSRKFILSAWGSDIFDIPQRSLIYRFFVRRALRKAYAVTAASLALGHATDMEVKGAKPVYLVPFGVDVGEFSPRFQRLASDTVKIGVVKSLEATYGIDILVRAFAQVYDRARKLGIQKKLKLIIVGKGSQQPLLQSMVYSLGIETQTEFKGSIPHSQVPKLLSELDVFVAPSRSESFGVALVEASACGIPVIATRVGGIPEVIDHEVTGLIINSEEVDELTEALWRLIMDESLRVRMGNAGREKALREFNWQANVEGMEALYYRYRDWGDAPID